MNPPQENRNTIIYYNFSKSVQVNVKINRQNKKMEFGPSYIS